jgi:hypothetical protein
MAMRLVDIFRYKTHEVKLIEVDPKEMNPEDTGTYKRYRALIDDKDVTEQVIRSGELPNWGHYAKELIDNREEKAP